MTWDIFRIAAEVFQMAGGTGIWIYSIFAILNFSLQDWPFVVSIVQCMWRPVRWFARATWHWSAKWSWEAVCSIGWLGMLAVNEYFLGLCFLSAASFGAFSKLIHWRPGNGTGIRTKSLGSVAIALGFLLAILVTLANKGTKSWSPAFDWVDSQLADRKPLPPWPALPSFISPRSAPAVHYTSKAQWTETQKELDELRNRSIPQQPKVIPAAKDGEVSVALVITSTTVTNVEMNHDIPPAAIPSFRCVGVHCYTERELKGNILDVPLSEKNEARLLFMVENISETIIAPPYVALSATGQFLPNGKGVNVYIAEQHGKDAPFAEWVTARTTELLPYKKDIIAYNYPFDIQVTDESITDFQLVFRILSTNLPVHPVAIACHVVRKTKR